MKIYYSYIIIMMGIMIGVISCQKDEIMTLNEEEVGTRIFFDYAYEQTSGNNLSDKITIYFGYDKYPKVDSTVLVPVRIMGMLADHDREFKYMIVDTSSTGQTGVNYDILPSFIDTDSRMGNLKIKIYNTPELIDSTYKVTVRLLPNETFGTYDKFEYSSWGEGMSPLEFHIYFNNTSEIPNLWVAKSSMFENYAFGYYSHKKFNFILQILGFERDFFMYDPETQNLNDVWGQRVAPATDAMAQVSVLNSWRAAMELALDDYEKEHGERLKEEDGQDMKMRK